MVQAEASADAESDLDLIRRIAAGDRRAFRRLFDAYGPRVFRYAVRTLGDAGKAEEVTNDVMFEVWKGAARFEGRSSVSTWIIGITRHRSLNMLRGKRFVTVDLDHSIELVDDETVSGADEHDQATIRRTLRSAIAKLPPEHRDVVELTFFHGHSYEEIAAIVGCPENTVKTRMFHARKRLRDLLGPRLAEALQLGAVA